MNTLAIFIPGVGYHIDKPLLYHSIRLARQLGYDVRTVSFSGLPDRIKGDAAKMKLAFDIAYEQTCSQLGDIDWSAYDRVLIVAKSVGTCIATRFAARYIPDAGKILYTPVAQTFDGDMGHAIAFVGDADSWSEYSEIESLAAEYKVELYSYEGCNHSLETGDVDHDLDVLCDVMRRTKEFMQNKEQN